MLESTLFAASAIRRSDSQRDESIVSGRPQSGSIRLSSIGRKQRSRSSGVKRSFKLVTIVRDASWSWWTSVSSSARARLLLPWTSRTSTARVQCRRLSSSRRCDTAAGRASLLATASTVERVSSERTTSSISSAVTVKSGTGVCGSCVSAQAESTRYNVGGSTESSKRCIKRSGQYAAAG